MMPFDASVVTSMPGSVRRLFSWWGRCIFLLCIRLIGCWLLASSAACHLNGNRRFSLQWYRGCRTPRFDNFDHLCHVIWRIDIYIAASPRAVAWDWQNAVIPLFEDSQFVSTSLHQGQFTIDLSLKHMWVEYSHHTTVYVAFWRISDSLGWSLSIRGISRCFERSQVEPQYCLPDHLDWVLPLRHEQMTPVYVVNQCTRTYVHCVTYRVVASMMDVSWSWVSRFECCFFWGLLLVSLSCLACFLLFLPAMTIPNECPIIQKRWSISNTMSRPSATRPRAWRRGSFFACSWRSLRFKRIWSALLADPSSRTL